MTRTWLLVSVLGFAACALPDPVEVGGGDLVRISAGAARTCGLDDAGRVFCWGQEGDTGAVVLPAQVDLGPVQAIDVSVGATYTCAVIQGGSVTCWPGVRGRPFALTGAPALATVNVGRFPCASTAAGAIWCWTEGGTDPVEVAAAGVLYDVRVDQFACGITGTGEARCWGGPLPATPTTVFDTVTWAEMQPMYGWGCGVPVGGSAACFTVTTGGVLGTLTLVNTLIIGDGTKYVHVTGEMGFAAFLSDGGRAYHKTTNQVHPTPEGSTVDWLSISAGSGHVCGQVADGRYACYRNNASGQLGDGTKTFRANAVIVGGVMP
jgi:Regulator of Chromosome Condensation (RCC1) repeat protein